MKENGVNLNVVKALVKAARDSGISMQQIADGCGIEYHGLYNKMAGSVKFSVAELRDFANFMRCDIRALIIKKQ